MAIETATIRVARTTRDLLIEQARERGMSLAGFLAEVAEEGHRQAVWRSEREASRLDARNFDALRETRDWEATLEDGIT